MTVTQLVYIRPQAASTKTWSRTCAGSSKARGRKQEPCFYLLNRKGEEFVLHEMYRDEDALAVHNENEALHELGSRAGEPLTAPPLIERMSYLLGTGPND